MAHKFVHETSNNRVKRFIALSLLIIFIIITIVTASINYARIQGEETSESFIAKYTPDVVHNITPTKQFVLGILSGIAFIPIPAPIELTFYVGLKQGNPVVLSMAATLIGFMIGNAISYVVGWKLSRHVVYLLSTRKIYALRRTINKYGVWAIVGMNLVPAPSDILSFSLGIAKYNAKRLLFFFTISVIIELSAIATFFYLMN